jgi:hypothetical protein
MLQTMWPLLCLAIAVAGLAWWIMSRRSLYRTLFSDPHLMEFGQGLAARKAAALRDVIGMSGGEIQSPDDPRILRTSAGLALVYTVSIREPATYVHHASISMPGRVTAHAVGETFILLWARLLGIEYERLALQVSPTSVHHAEFVLDENEQSSFAQRPVEAPTVALLQAFHAESARARQGLRWDRSLAAIGT